MKVTGNAEYGQWIKALIAGNPGSGKTLMSSTFLNPVYASVEGGLMSVADRHMPYVEIDSSAKLNKMQVALQQDPETREKIFKRKIDTVIIDTVDEMQRILIRERLLSEKRDDLSRADYGWIGNQMKGILRGFRNLDMNVVFTCHLKETKDDVVGDISFKPQMVGQTADEISGMVDLALVLQNKTVNQIVNGGNVRTIKRYLQTFPDPRHPWVKDRSGKLPQEFEINFQDDYARMHGLIYPPQNANTKKEAA